MSSLDGEAIDLRPVPAFASVRQRSAAGPQLRGRWIAPGALMSGDALSYLIALGLLHELGWLPAEDPLTWCFVGLIASLCLIQFSVASLYPGYGLYDHERWRRRLLISLATTLGAFAAAALLEPSWHVATRTAPALLLALAFQPLIREVVVRQLHRRRLWGSEVAVLAEPGTAQRLSAALRANWRLGLVPVPESEAGAPRTAVLASMVSSDEVQSHLRSYDSLLLLADMPGLKLSGLQPASLGGRVGIALRGHQPELGDHRLRRLSDLAIALIAVVPALPVMGTAALAVWMADPGPVFYRQEREGMHGRVVRIIKLRTMYQDAERRLHDVLASDPALRSEWERHFKLKNDPRILPVIGGILRSTSCDELPQLFNVIAGQMSIVGPRPFPTYHLGAMNAEFRVKRRSVMPGLTGLWQVSDRSEADVERQQQLDEFYIDNRSFWFDWHILFSTARAVLGRSGA